MARSKLLKRCAMPVCLAAIAIASVSTTAWAAPYASGISVSGTTVTFILNQDADDVKVNLTPGGTLNLGALAKGSHSFDTGGAAAWEIVVTNSDPLGWTHLTADIDPGASPNKVTHFERPVGVSVNKHPWSPNFGKIYVSHSSSLTTLSGRACQDGIYMLFADASDAGFADGGVDWSFTGTDTGYSSPFKSTIGPDDHLYVASFSNDLAWEFSGDMSVATPLIDDTNKTLGPDGMPGGSPNNDDQFVISLWVSGTKAGGDRKIYLVNSNYYDSERKGLIEYTLGSQDMATTNDIGVSYIDGVPGGYYGYYPYDVSRDSAGDWYMNNYRASANQASPLVKFLDDPFNLPIQTPAWEASSAYVYSYGIDVNEVCGVAAYGQYATGEVFFFDMATGAFVESFDAGSRMRDIAFDAAGNVYTVDNIVERLRIWSRGGDTVAVTRSDGTFSFTPDCRSLVPPAPKVDPILTPGGTSLTVSAIAENATQVAVYKNGEASPVATVSTPTLVPPTHTFSIPAMVAGDYYQATQTTPGGTSARSVARAVVPDPIALPAPYPNLTEDFEAATLDPAWIQMSPPLTLSTEQAHSGTQSAKEAAVGGGELGSDLLPTDPSEDQPIVLEFWMWHDMPADPDTQPQNHFGSIGNWSGNAYREGTVSQLFQIGMFDGFNTPANWPRVKYHGRCYGGGGPNWVQLNDGPDRSAGWHKMAIKLGSSTACYYIDGQRGVRIADLTGIVSLDSIYLSNRYTSATDAFYDDVKVQRVTNNAPTINLPATLNANTGVAIAATNVTAAVGGAPADDPDTAELILKTALPAGLSASAAVDEVVKGNPTATITITGTPQAGTEGTYEITFEYADDMTDRNNPLPSAKLTIVIAGAACNTPPADVDGDNDVDLGDFGIFQACFNGPNRPWPGPPVDQQKCACLDSDTDGDVDLTDFGVFQTCFNGPNRPASCP